MGNGIIRPLQTLEDQDLKILKEIDEPTIQLYRIFQSRTKTLSELVKVSSPKYLTFGQNNQTENRTSESSKQSDSSAFFPVESNSSLRYRRCRPEHGRGRNYDVDYLKQISVRAMTETPNGDNSNPTDDRIEEISENNNHFTTLSIIKILDAPLKNNLANYQKENSKGPSGSSTHQISCVQSSQFPSQRAKSLTGIITKNNSIHRNFSLPNLHSPLCMTGQHAAPVIPTITIEGKENDEILVDEGKASEKEWKNVVFQTWRNDGGLLEFAKKLERRLKKYANKPGLGSRTFLSMTVNRAKKRVTSVTSPIRQWNSVGAFGYGVVLSDPRIPENDFFKPDIRFRIRLRHSSIQNDDDASSCQRETAIKFADQNEDGPLDLILLTGRIPIAENCRSFLKVMSLVKPDDLKAVCTKDPLFHHALVDGTRRAPTSYTNLTYYSHVVYLFIPKNQRHCLVKFRLIPGGSSYSETGLLDEDEQKEPWFRQRRKENTQSKSYLRDEFQKRMERFEAVRYTLQLQMTNRLEEIYWNPQLIWDETESPWLDLMRIQLTTTIPLTSLCRTYFNIVDKPSCLRFRVPKSVQEFHSLQYCLSGMYTRFELDHLQIVAWKNDASLKKESAKRGRVPYFVTLCTATVKDTKSRVDVFIALIGTRGRTAPQKLDCQLDEDEDENLPPISEGCEHFAINVESVGEILAVSLTVRHRHLTDEWFLRYLVLSDPERLRVRHFPCYNVVLSKVTLRPGEVSLPQKDCHELLRQERLLELRDRKSEYQWCVGSSYHLFGWIGAETTRDLPLSDRLQAEKFAGMPWDIDPTAMETLLPFLATAASRGLLPNIPLFFRQTASTGDNLPSIGPMMRHAKTASKSRPSSQAALRRWRKIRFAIAFITKVRIPDGPKGEMCRSVQDDVDFGRHFLLGPNPFMVKQLKNSLLPNLPVTDEMIAGFINLNHTLQTALNDGLLYYADYSILADIPTIRHDSDHRFLAAPLVLFYQRDFGDLIPLAIQLNQTPSPDNHVWTPRDNPEDWIMAKLWVKCADFHYHFAISHLLKCHFVAEPFAIAMMRQLSSSHPVYKLLKPHFRYLLVTNTLIRRHIMRKNCAIDKYTSIGSDGFWYLMQKYLRCQFTWDEMDPRFELRQRGVEKKTQLPYYYYRDDAVSLWNVIYRYTNDMLKLFYTSNQDVVEDSELQSWIADVAENGFPGMDDDVGRVYKSYREYSNYNPASMRSVSKMREVQEVNLSDCDDNFEAPESPKRISGVDFDLTSEKDEAILENEQQDPSSEAKPSDSVMSQDVEKTRTSVNGRTSRYSVRTSSSSFSSCTIASRSGKFKKLPRRSLEMANLPETIETIDELSDIVTKLIYATTCQHSATHTEALDLYGFMPGIPSMMRQAPMSRKQMCTRDFIGKTLPDQFPDAYYGSLSTLLQVHKPDENSLGDSSETYFVEDDAKRVIETFQHELKKLTKGIQSRNRITGIMYENLSPAWIPNSIEPLPFLPKIAKEEAMSGKCEPNKTAHIYISTPSVPMSILPICMFLARANPGRGGATRAARTAAFDQRVDGVGVPRKDKEERTSYQKQKFDAMF